MANDSEVVASRRLTRSDGSSVTVEIERPRPFHPTDPDGDWLCRYRIGGLDDQSVDSFAGGVDSVKALLLALTKIGDYLASRDDIALVFHGDPALGFPRSRRRLDS